MISWVMTAAALAFLFAVVLAHAELCSSTAQQVTTIARIGAQPGLMTFFCGECGMADSIWSLPPTGPAGDIGPLRQGAVTEQCPDAEAAVSALKTMPN